MTPLYFRTLTGSNLLIVFYGKKFEELFLLTLTVGTGQLLALFTSCLISRVRHFTYVDNLIAVKYINEQDRLYHLRRYAEA
ncbi:hypothetical protein BDZ91DRAFT_753068 [Kalaharituber pfeilii]|nr:hypothetical protein BDZ91DRAFT_753068 [Kalaharituber pfeilii]